MNVVQLYIFYGLGSFESIQNKNNDVYIKERDKQLRENSKKGIKGRKQLNIELNKLNIIILITVLIFFI